VETPFDVDKFELLLADHPNQPFVKSVMTGLHEGFWPFDEGDWKIELDEVTPDYNSNPEDAEAIRAFRDREIGAGRWSESLDDTELLPGMKSLPCSWSGRMRSLALLQTTPVLESMTAFLNQRQKSSTMTCEPLAKPFTMPELLILENDW
jgi:hypothetical protein